MCTQRSSLAQRAFRLTRVGSSPKAAPPTHRRLAAAGLAAVVVSLATDILLAAVGRAAFTVPAMNTAGQAQLKPSRRRAPRENCLRVALHAWVIFMDGAAETGVHTWPACAAAAGRAGG